MYTCDDRWRVLTDRMGLETPRGLLVLIGFLAVVMGLMELHWFQEQGRMNLTQHPAFAPLALVFSHTQSEATPFGFYMTYSFYRILGQGIVPRNRG